MSNNNCNVTITIDQTCQVFDTDFNGNIIDGEHAKDVIVRTKCAISSDKFRTAFSVHARLPKERIRSTKEKRISDNQIDFLTFKALSSYLGTIPRIDLFHVHQILLHLYLPEKLPKVPENSYEFLKPFSSSIQQTAYDNILHQFPEYTAGKESFDSAVKKLYDFAGQSPSSISYNQSEIRSLVSFLDRSLQCADLGVMYSWYKEKQSGIQYRFNDMIRRKQGSHPGYIRDQEYIKRNLFLYNSPDCWLKHPPLLQTI